MSLLLDALRRSEMSLAAPTPSADPANAEASTPSPGLADAEIPTTSPQPPSGLGSADTGASGSTQAAQNLLNAASPAANRAVRPRKLWLGVGAAVLLLPMAGWLGWMLWEDAQPMAFAPPPAAQATGTADSPAAQTPPVTPVAQVQVAQVVSPPAPKAAEAPATAADAVAPPPPSVAPPRAAAANTPSPNPKAPSQPVAPPPAAAKSAPTSPRSAPPPTSEPAPARSSQPRAPAPGAARAPAKTPAATPPVLVRSDANRQLQDAWTALGQGDAPRALSLYRQVLAERPEDPDATLGVAVALHRQKNLPEAWVAYQRSLKLWPDNATARTGLLAILSESDAQTAESRLNEWVQERPRDAAAQAALGNLLGRQSRWAEALPWLTRAQSLEPMQATYAYNLAVALDQSRRYAEAARQYQLALQLGGAGVPVQPISNRLRELANLGAP